MKETTQIIKSTFDRFNTIAMVSTTFLGAILLCFMVYEWITDVQEFDLFQRIMLTFFPALAMPLLIRIELPKIRKLVMDDDDIAIINPFTGRKRKYAWDTLDGYTTMIHSSKGGGFTRELSLIANKRIVHEISSFHISNYDEIKRYIVTRIPNLGAREFEYFKYIKERLFR